MASFLRFILNTSIIIFFATAIGCGGGPNENPNFGGGGGGGGGSTNRTIVVTVEGTDGTVVIRLNTEDLTFSGSGSRNITSFGNDEFVQATIISAPEGEFCVLAPSNQQQVVVNNAVRVECGSIRVTGKVKNFFTSDAISSATVTLSQVTGDTATAVADTVTSADGSYAFDADPALLGNRLVITVSYSSFAPFSAIVVPTVERPNLIENIFLVPRFLTDSETASADMIFRIAGIPVLEIPANGLVLEGGGAPVGDVTASITLLDPSFSSKILPGRYELGGGGGDPTYIETFGGISFELRDSNGSLLALAGGVQATVTVPAANTTEEAPAAANIYTFNSENGYWTDPIAATISSFGNTITFEASVSELSQVYTAGITYTSVLVQGIVVDSSGNPFAGVTVVSQGRSYNGLAFAVSDEEGRFSVPAKASSDVLVYALAGVQSRTVEASTGTSNLTLDREVLLDESSSVITLTWGEDPSDLDSHLFWPKTDGGRFHILYSNKEVTVNGTTMFLDVDDVTSFGPEITTIPGFPISGRYEFFVKLFAGESNILASPSRVELNLQGESFVFSPPDATVTECWHVFDMDVDSALRGSLVRRNQFVAASACDTGLVTGTPVSSTKPTSIFAEAVKNKYYAEKN